MNDQLAIQYALFHGMRSCSLFADLNIVLGREYISTKVAQDAVWQVKSPSGKVGIGAIIQIPSLLFPKPNSLQREREYSIGIYEEPDFNWTPGVGTLRGADDWADEVVDFLWNWNLWRASGLIPSQRAAIPDTRFLDQGIIGIKAVCTLRQERAQPARCARPVITVDGGRNVTLTVTDGSAIYYTLDGFSTPAPNNTGALPGEQAATPYAAPFNVAANTLVRAGSYAAGILPSHIAESTIT